MLKFNIFIFCESLMTKIKINKNYKRYSAL